MFFLLFGVFSLTSFASLDWCNFLGITLNVWRSKIWLLVQVELIRPREKKSTRLLRRILPVAWVLEHKVDTYWTTWSAFYFNIISTRIDRQNFFIPQHQSGMPKWKNIVIKNWKKRSQTKVYKLSAINLTVRFFVCWTTHLMNDRQHYQIAVLVSNWCAQRVEDQNRKERNRKRTIISPTTMEIELKNVYPDVWPELRRSWG